MLKSTIALVGLIAMAGCGSEAEPPKTTNDAPATTSGAPIPTTIPTPPTATSEPTAPPAASASATEAPAEEAPALVYAGLKIWPAKPVGVSKIDIHSDGEIFDGDGRVLFTITKNALRHSSGETRMWLEKGGVLKGLQIANGLQFNEKDELVGPGKTKVVLNESGTLTVTDSEAKPKSL
jgi:hypothetical protein